MRASRHRANPSVAASVDLDVEGGGRLDEDYDGGWSTAATAWSATGPAAYTQSMGVLQSGKCHLAWARRGFADGNRWQEAVNVAARSPELRSGIVKGFALSASIAALIFVFELAFFPSHLFRRSSDENVGEGSTPHHYRSETSQDSSSFSSVGNSFWLYPLVAGAYFLASSWTMDVAKAAHKLKHGHSMSGATQGVVPADSKRRIILESYRIILVINYALISFGLQMIPCIGRGLAFLFMSFIDAYYCFEQTWIARGWSVDRRMRFAESRWAYFVAFGLPSTLVSYFHPSGLLNLMLFMLVFPFCTVLALLATPSPRVAPTGSTTLTPQNSGLPSSLADNLSLSQVLPPRLPIFWPTVKLYRLVLRAFPSAIEGNALSTPSMAGSNVWRAAAMSPSSLGNVNEKSSFEYFNGSPAGGGYAGQAFGFGSSADSTISATGLKRGATAAQVVDGAWNGHAFGGASGRGSPNMQGPHARMNAGLASAYSNGGSPTPSGNGTPRYGTPPASYDNLVASPAVPATGVGSYAANGNIHHRAAAFASPLSGAPPKKRD